MPAVIQGSEHSMRFNRSFEGVEYSYDYPNDLDLRPTSKLHQKLVSEIMRRARDSHAEISKRFPVWQEIDRTLTAYVDLTESDKKVEKRNEERGERKPVSIVYPNSYAILETMLAYMVVAFFQNPMFRYEGSGPEDTVGSILLEKVIQMHCEKNKVPLNLHTQFRDNFAYGFGVSVPTWKTQYGMIPERKIERVGGFMGMGGQMQESIEFERGIIHEGNALVNVEPYNVLPDPSVSIHELQDGEYFGWIDNTNMMQLLSAELDDDEMFNCRYLRHVSYGETSIGAKDANNRKTSTMGNSKADYKNNVDVIHMYVKLIPEDWKLGDGEYPETWLFRVAADCIIISCQPINAMHGNIPASVCATEFDGYSTTPVSRLEIMSGMQNVLDFMFNSHVANVRKAMNDMFVVDPYLVNVNDIKDPDPGKLIRLRRPAWGQGVKDAVMQLGVHDVTRGNMADAGMISELMKSIQGTDNPMMGNLRRGGPDRLTSAEFQGTMSGAVSRMERVAKIAGWQAMQDLAIMFASNVQQLMEKDVYAKTVGNWPKVIQDKYGAQNSSLPVSPLDLVVSYDVLVRDGSIPGGNFSQAWLQLFQTIASSEQLLQRFDVVRIFKHIALNLGAKNIDEFEMTKVRNQDTETVQRQAEAGNFASVEEVIG